MAEIRNSVFVRNETNTNSMGGTERMVMELANRVEAPLLQEFQIVASRKRELQDDKIRVFWCHDLPGDPESEFLKDKANHDLFHQYIFVSNWQMQGYMQAYGLPWSKCNVIQNAIVPIPEHEKPDEDECLRFIYTPTPHRGLNILIPVFAKLAEKYDHIHLDVYSSFKLYGWEERDNEYKETFDVIDAHPRMTNHGTKSNDEIREALQRSHFFAYPSIWPETSCLCLIEAMSAGLTCVHSNYGGLFETAGMWTQMYPINENHIAHAQFLYDLLDANIEDRVNSKEQERALLAMVKNYVDTFYSWDYRANQWATLLRGLVSSVKDRSIPSQKFVYQT